MKSVYNYISEALIKKDTKIKHNWTIKDAQDGDIITIKGKYWDDEIFIIIFKKINNNDIQIYGYYFSEDESFEESTGCFDIDSTCWLSTKDEKQTLFNAMNNCRYKWDPNKKELVKI